MNNTFSKLIFNAGAKKRNPNLFSYANELKKTDFFSREQYDEIKRNKLSKLFDFASKHSNYYQKTLPKYSEQDDVLNVLKDAPILTKSDLIQNHDSIQCYDQFAKLFLAETSGSTGQPFKFKKDLKWDTLNRASIVRSYWWYKVQPWEKNGYFWGYNFDSSQVFKTQLLDGLQNRFRAFNFNKKDLAQFLEKLTSASFLHGYSSVIYEVAKIAIELGYSPKDFPKLKMIKGTSEKIYNYYHVPVSEVFGSKIVSEYGAAETGIIAFECPEGNMHVNEENVIVEEIDGNAVVTNLNAFSMPVIRYKLGDSIVLNKTKKCPCGRNSQIIEEVVGRVGKTIQGKVDRYPSLTLYYIFKNISINKGVDIQYQGFQAQKGVLELRITRELSSEERKWISGEKKKYFKTDLDLIILENQQIHDKKGKLKDFITELE